MAVQPDPVAARERAQAYLASHTHGRGFAEDVLLVRALDLLAAELQRPPRMRRASPAEIDLAERRARAFYDAPPPDQPFTRAREQARERERNLEAVLLAQLLIKVCRQLRRSSE